ncbi:MAG: hypothetical protein HZC41_22315 [Chloroflexi bacterium]|nr:hypothetical protein [Chloroflexota bacterium]
MLPLLTPRDTDSRPRNRKQVMLVVAAACLALVIGALLVSADAVQFQRTVLPILVSGFFMALTLGSLIFIAIKQSGGAQEKPKREGVDMYTLIDRLVDDLDDDEADYLRRRLDARDRHPKRDLTDDALDLLDRRAEGRRVGRREE